MKVLITGGFGYIGSWLSNYFCKNGYDVHILSNSNDRFLKGVNYNFIKADVSNINELKSKVKENYDYCIHLASNNDYFIEGYAEKALHINALGTRNILETIVNKNIKKFIYFSTSHVYGAAKEMVDESFLPNPLNDYACTQLFGEYYVRQFGIINQLPYTIVRPTNGYGAPKFLNTTKWYLVFNSLVRSAYENKEIILNSDGQAMRDFIWIGDICKIIESILITKETVNEIINLSSGKMYKIIEIAEIVKKVYESRYKRSISIKINPNNNPKFYSLKISNQKLCKLINFHPNEKFLEEADSIFSLLEGGR